MRYFNLASPERFMKSLQDTCNNVIDPDAGSVANRLAQTGGWSNCAYDPEFRLGQFDKVFELVLPEWTLTPSDDPVTIKNLT